MKAYSRILFPTAVATIAIAALLGSGPEMNASAHNHSVTASSQDTVLYTADAYKIGRRGNFIQTIVADSSMLAQAELELPSSDTLGGVADSLVTADSIAVAADSAKIIADSLRRLKEEKIFAKDSIAKSRLRILQTFALPDSMQYKRIISWKLDQDFQKMNTSIPDTGFNYFFNEYPFRKKDVNATWLGVSGSPVQEYNFFKRENNSGYDFFAPYESWSYDKSTLPQYNTKTPYTELQYFGTLLAGASKETDNIHLLTTQNFTPELNVTLMFNVFGGAGILENEKTRNSTFAAYTNYLGKNYLLHTGYIGNKISRGENGGIQDLRWVRDTTVDAREIPVHSSTNSSYSKHQTFYVDQQFRIPFNFINRIKARKDSTFVLSDSLERNITTAFIGHSSSFENFGRTFKSDGQEDIFNVKKLDNKVFLKLQPWSESAIVSKLNAGIGDYMEFTSARDSISIANDSLSPVCRRNSVYVYAGVEGNVSKYFKWDAKGKYVFLGNDSGDFAIDANARLNLYPFRRHKGSPLSIGAHFETSLKEPHLYQQSFQSVTTPSLAWQNDFGKRLTTKVEGFLDIPHWNLKAEVGYALLNNYIYYNETGIICQHNSIVNVLSASLRKDFVIGNFLHLDNRILFQKSSNPDVLPLPMLAANLKYFIQFVVQRNEAGNKVLEMQFGANAFMNTKWYSPAYNTVLGVFQNQKTTQYYNGPIFDVFLNAQWKKACIFIKMENIGNGWPLKKPDYFTADGYLYPQMKRLATLKLGIYWPFYISPVQNRKVSFESQSANDSKK